MGPTAVRCYSWQAMSIFYGIGLCSNTLQMKSKYAHIDIDVRVMSTQFICSYTIKVVCMIYLIYFINIIGQKE